MSENRAHTPSAPPVAPAALRTVVDERSRALGLTRDRVARAAGVGRSTLYDWLAGTGQPSASGWRGLAGALDMPVAELFLAVGVPLAAGVEHARLERGWTRGDLAREAGVSASTVRALEHGECARPDAVARVARALGMPAEFVEQHCEIAAPAATPLGRAIERERVARGWTISDVARHLGTVRQLVSAWLLGAEPVAERWHGALADLTGLPVAQIAELAEQSRSLRPAAAHASWVRDEREQRGWSRAELAERVAVAVSTVEQWEAGRRTPGARSRTQLVRAFDAA